VEFILSNDPNVSHPGFSAPDKGFFYGYFLLPETLCFQPTNPADILKNLGLILLLMIRNSDNTEVADWCV